MTMTLTHDLRKEKSGLGVKDPRGSSYDPRLNSRTGGISLADAPYFDIDL